MGLEPTVILHVLSARGLDVLDEELHKAQRAVSADATPEAIATFADLEERYRAAGGYSLEGEIARLAEGIGLRQDVLFADIDSLSGGQRRRVDIVRGLFGHREALAHGGARALPGGDACDQPRPQVARPRHHEGPQPGRRWSPGVQGQLH